MVGVAADLEAAAGVVAPEGIRPQGTLLEHREDSLGGVDEAAGGKPQVTLQAVRARVRLLPRVYSRKRT